MPLGGWHLERGRGGTSFPSLYGTRVYVYVTSLTRMVVLCARDEMLPDMPSPSEAIALATASYSGPKRGKEGAAAVAGDGRRGPVIGE